VTSISKGITKRVNRSEAAQKAARTIAKKVGAPGIAIDEHQTAPIAATPPPVSHS
jgi:hypothetical protein